MNWEKKIKIELAQILLEILVTSIFYLSLRHHSKFQVIKIGIRFNFQERIVEFFYNEFQY